MKIYIASSFDLIPKINKVCEALEKEGHEITVKWWDRIYQTQNLGSQKTHDLKQLYNNLHPDEFYTRPECIFTYKEDRRGVQNADALVLVADDKPRKYNGANIELGMADAWGKPCLSIGTLENSAMYAQVIKCYSIEDLIIMLGNVGIAFKISTPFRIKSVEGEKK